MKFGTRKIETRRTSGCIEDHFEFGGRRYVHCREDPNSNYLPKVRNDLSEIRNPYERVLVRLVYELLYR